MKKRFINRLTKLTRKKDLSFFISAIYITLISGIMIGCSTIETGASEKSAQVDIDTTNLNLEYNIYSQADLTDDDDSDTDKISNGVQNNYKSILLGQKNFISTDLSNESLNIDEIGKAITIDDSITVNATKFAIIDIDGDGEDEIVLWLQINGISDYGFEILHDQKGKVYGYTLQYRAFMGLKTDGTFTFSSGAADSGIGKMIFSKTGYSIIKQAYSQSKYDSNNESTIQYFINDESCSKDEFNAVINAQEQKSDIEWHDLSENNINAVLY